MKIFLSSIVYVSVCFFASSLTVHSQPLSNKTTTQTKGLFDNDSLLEITISGNLRDLLNDRSETPQSHPVTVSYRQKDNTEITVTAEGKTRGHFRKLKTNCLYPPLQIHFMQTDSLKLSVFKEQEKIKLVMPCQGDEYVIREWLVYKLYNLVTPKSFRARLVKITMSDTKGKKSTAPFYGVFLEEEKQVAFRNNSIAISKKLEPGEVEQQPFLTMAVFEYLIGNTDWSVQYLQNIKLIAPDSNATPTAIPYDFDHAGLVDAPYAKPAEELLMNNVRQRRYRGYCVKDMRLFDSTVTLYNRIKNDVYATYTNCNLLDEKFKKTALRYLDEFYVTINNPDKMKKEFQYPCDKTGTGNVVIKGLREE